MTDQQYDTELERIYKLFPSYQVVGSRAFKPGLDNMRAFDFHLGSPSTKLRTIHIAGTNGKGSTSHLLAAALAGNGLRVGLYTSPHLVDFRERIKICTSVGYQMIPREETYNFITENRDWCEKHGLSFFEITTGMAFSWFARQKVDVAVIETGMGGRLDSTNILEPDLCIITNIGFDHCQYLGNTLAEIASEKAGIIKPGVPAVIGESCPETAEVFAAAGVERGSEIIFSKAPEVPEDLSGFDLQGVYQQKNICTVRTALKELRKIGYYLEAEKVEHSLRRAAELTGLMGRWQVVRSCPKVVCDTGHNAHGLRYVTAQLASEMALADASGRPVYDSLRCVVGVVVERDLSSIAGLLPRDAFYYFTQARGTRALPPEKLAEYMTAEGLNGTVVPDVADACAAALADSSQRDFVFIGASSYVVAEALEYLSGENRR